METEEKIFDGFDPPYNHLIVEKIEETEKQYGNIVMPNMSEESTLICKVIAKGPGWVTITNQLIPTQVEIGDIVAISRVGGYAINIDRQKYICCKDTDVLTKLKYK